MASTRFGYDIARKEDQLRQSTTPCDYIINAPGNGTAPAYMEDPHIRLQKWGANLANNVVTIEGSLRGLGQQTGSDCLGKDEYNRSAPAVETSIFPSNTTLTTDQPRASNPAWELRDQATTQHGAPTFVDPQSNIFQPFRMNVSTRILEKDHYTQPKISEPLRTQYLLPAHALPTNNK